MAQPKKSLKLPPRAQTVESLVSELVSSLFCRFRGKDTEVLQVCRVVCELPHLPAGRESSFSDATLFWPLFGVVSYILS